MRRIWSTDPAVLAEMARAVAAYTGPIRRFPASVARAHEFKVTYYEPPRPQKPVRPALTPGNGRERARK
jgi:hypothetical protein